MRKRAAAVVAFPEGPKVVASVSTTTQMIVVTLANATDRHFTYPPDGRFHVTPHGPDSARSFLKPAPAFQDLDYHPLAEISVPISGAEVERRYRSSNNEWRIDPPQGRPGVLEIGVLGQRASEDALGLLGEGGADVGLFGGPRSDTTIVFRYRGGTVGNRAF